MTESDKPEQPPSDTPSSSAPPPPPPYPSAPPPYPYAGGYPGAYPPPPPSYGGYPPASPQAVPKNGLGIAALVVAIVGLFTVYGGIVLGVVAIVLGFLGRGRAKRGEATNGGVALAGIVLGFLGVIVSIVAIALTVWGFNQLGGGDFFDCLRRASNDPAAQQQCEEQFSSTVEDRFNVTPTP
jgi:hypothetical protein